LGGVGPNGTPKAERRPSGCQNAEEIEAFLPPIVTPDSSALPGAATVGRTQLAPETAPGPLLVPKFRRRTAEGQTGHQVGRTTMNSSQGPNEDPVRRATATFRGI